MKRVISVLVLTVMVAVTIGIPIYRHTCHVFDRSELSVLTQEQFCKPGESSATAVIDFKCCSVEHFDTALDYETISGKSIEVLAISMLDSRIDSYEIGLVADTSDPLPVLRPPPLANRTILNKIQRYLI